MKKYRETEDTVNGDLLEGVNGRKSKGIMQIKSENVDKSSQSALMFTISCEKNE